MIYLHFTKSGYSVVDMENHCLWIQLTAEHLK